MLGKFANKRVLLLQGPLGPFFRRFGQDLENHGAKVTKIAFNAGDALYYIGTDYIPYRGSLNAWPKFIGKLLEEKQIDTVFFIGDMRPYHLAAKPIIREKEIDLYVFEEGYLRPDFITLERDGVNGNSPMSRDPNFYSDADLSPTSHERQVGNTFPASACLTSLYYVAFNFFSFLYPRYEHYRDSNVFKHAFCQVRSGVRKRRYKRIEGDLIHLFENELKGKYFFVPLQVWNDFQWKHAPFDNVEELLDCIFDSFSRCAHMEHKLVVKHHIADRGYCDYSEMIRRKVEKYDLEGRVYYVYDLHLPTLLKNALGTVVMNSTVGLSSIHHGTPVKVLGNAIYDIPPISFGGSLDDFWTDVEEVDEELYHRFRGWLEYNNQFNGNFYTRIQNSEFVSGVKWKRPRRPKVRRRRSVAP